LHVVAAGVIDQILDELVRRREVFAGVVAEQEPAVVGEERVPIPAQVDLRVVISGVDLVGGDQRAVPRKLPEEVVRSLTGFQDEIAPAGRGEVMAELQPGRSAPEDEVFDSSWIDAVIHEPVPPPESSRSVRVSPKPAPRGLRDRRTCCIGKTAGLRIGYLVPRTGMNGTPSPPALSHE